MVYAFPDSEIGLMEANLAAQIMYSGETSEVVNEKTQEYAQMQSSLSAAKRGYVDCIVEPETIRKHIIYSFEMLFTKKESRLTKKHGTV